jgi:hypothetical protein
MISGRFRRDFGPVSRHERSLPAIETAIQPGFIAGETAMTGPQTVEATAVRDNVGNSRRTARLRGNWAVDPTTGRPVAHWVSISDSELRTTATLYREVEMAPPAPESAAGTLTDIISVLLLATGIAVGCWAFWQNPYPAADYAGTVLKELAGMTLGFVIAGLIVMPIRQAIKRRSSPSVRAAEAQLDRVRKIA